MSKRPLGITFFPEDWTRPCQALPPLEFGVLLRLALQSIDSPEPGTLPNSDRTLAFRAGVSVGEWETIRPVLAEFMEVAGDAVRFPTIKRRYDSAAAHKREKEKAGRDAANQRWRRVPNADALGTQCQPIATPMPSAFCVPVPVLPPEGYINAGASAAFDRSAAVQAISAAFPPTNAGSSPAKVRQAVYRLGGSSGEARFHTEQEAAEWLLGRVKAWAASKLCRTTPQAYRKGCGAWMDEAMYDAPDSEWDHPYKGANGQTQTASMGAVKTGALERIKAQEQSLRSGGAA